MSGKPCDSCKLAGSFVFCRSDSVALCLACDTNLHGSATAASRHARIWMCEVCEQAPASVTCKADAAALCSACDSDIHSANPLARRHERVPVVPFYECPAFRSTPFPSFIKPSESPDDDTCQKEDADAASWLVCNGPSKMDGQDLKPSDYMFPDVDPYLDLDYAASMDGAFGATSDSVVPVQIKPVPPPQPLIPPSSTDRCVELDFSCTKLGYPYASLSHSLSSSSLDVGVVPEGNNSAMADVSNPFGSSIKMGIDFCPSIATAGTNQTAQISSLDREARVLRYREKKKTRKFEKTIRYASRKAYAEVRPRIKGRFAKRSDISMEAVGIYSTALIADGGYGVVPIF